MKNTKPSPALRKWSSLRNHLSSSNSWIFLRAVGLPFLNVYISPSTLPYEASRSRRSLSNSVFSAVVGGFSIRMKRRQSRSFEGRRELLGDTERRGEHH